MFQVLCPLRVAVRHKAGVVGEVPLVTRILGKIRKLLLLLVILHFNVTIYYFITKYAQFGELKMLIHITI